MIRLRVVFIQAGALHGLIITSRFGIDRERFAGARKDVFLRGIDREMAQLGIGHVPGRVIVAVIAGREVRRADRQARERQPKAAIRAAEQLGHDRLALVVGKTAEQQRRRVGHCCAEAVHLLEMLDVSIVTASSPEARPTRN